MFLAVLRKGLQLCRKSGLRKLLIDAYEATGLGNLRDDMCNTGNFRCRNCV